MGGSRKGRRECQKVKGVKGIRKGERREKEGE